MHGIASGYGTMYPSGNALGATWNRTALHRVGRSIALEARASHNAFTHSGNRGMNGGLYSANGLGLTLYSPNMNLVRTPLWGRAQEVYGEDPFLTAMLAGEWIDGAQTKSKDTKGRLLTAACAKHFAAYDVENHPVDRVLFDARLKSRDLFETYLSAFRHAIVDRDAVHVMCSFNSINGVPACANGDLLNGILRGKWGFRGWVVSDYDAWANLVTRQQYAQNFTEAAAVGINNGLDQEGGGTAAIEKLNEAVESGAVSLKTISESFRRIFRGRIKLGMLDPPTSVAWNNLTMTTECQTVQRAREAKHVAIQSLALYRNVNDTLPLRQQKDGPKKSGLAVIGPFADSGVALLGNYATPPAKPGTPADPVSILTGIRDKVGPSVDVIFQPGCIGVTCKDDSLFQQAFNASRDATATILVLGTQVHGASCSGDTVACEGEGNDRTSIRMPGLQLALAANLSRRNTGTPLVCVLVHGGSLALSSLMDDCDAVLDAWFPGAQGGPAVASVIFGDVAPSGKSPVTYYLNDQAIGNGDQHGDAGDMDMYRNGLTYRFIHNASNVVIPFGFGLSYTAFAYINASVARHTIKACDTITVTVTVKNIGQMSGDEVVQLYAVHPSASPNHTRDNRVPRIRLVNFTKIHIQSAEKMSVTLSVTPRWRSTVVAKEDFWNPDVVIEKGQLRLWVGGRQPNLDDHLSDNNGVYVDIDISSSAKLSNCS